jgi:hypothetical protein
MMAATLLGGEGDDVLYAGVGADSLDGGTGRDTLVAIQREGTPTLHGGDGDDVLVAYSQARLFGDAGDDRLTFRPDKVMAYGGGDGYDSLYAHDWDTHEVFLVAAEAPTVEKPAGDELSVDTPDSADVDPLTAGPSTPAAAPSDSPAAPSPTRLFATASPFATPVHDDEPIWDAA